ncbi:hypothetical protein JRO89_XS06G0106900 [Xanthoceras sorbifolium]|uniref:Uncharacterized protein n=1 Tax=Xanthoceras sorbifolium TaxID=99658 RepID=A0ABQ8HXM2_9ROSI|nr:hypothetical protein JRO89_XS06G0106900 [Xanthoceras sorbifolium]
MALMLEGENPVSLLNTSNVVVAPVPTLATLMNRLVNRVVSSSDLLVAEDVNVTIFSRIWGLVQCTPDITPSDSNIL